MRRLSATLITIVAIAVCQAEGLRLATLNTYLLFKPHNRATGGRLMDKGPANADLYERKIANLIELTTPWDVLAVQEVGSREEVVDLARRADATPVFVQGRDTYTGQDVAFVHSLRSGYRAVHYGRVPMLERRLSKHLLLVIDGPRRRFNLLNVHLVRANTNLDKNEDQRVALMEWITAARKHEPDAVYVILGDFNIDVRGPVLEIGRDALEDLDWDYTHVEQLRLDRMILIGDAHWNVPLLIRPPYGRRPNDVNRMLWSDHFALAGSVITN